jgi:hypothetical protein
MFFRQEVDGGEADVVPRAVVARARVSEADDEPQGVLFLFVQQLSSRCSGVLGVQGGEAVVAAAGAYVFWCWKGGGGEKKKTKKLRETGDSCRSEIRKGKNKNGKLFHRMLALTLHLSPPRSLLRMPPIAIEE